MEVASSDDTLTLHGEAGGWFPGEMWQCTVVTRMRKRCMEFRTNSSQDLFSRLPWGMEQRYVACLL